MGRRLSSRRREYIRRDRRASCGPRGIGGIRDPVDVRPGACGKRRNATYVLGGGVALEIWLNGLVLLVEVGEIGNKILDDVGVRQRVDAGFALGIGGDTAWMD